MHSDDHKPMLALFSISNGPEDNVDENAVAESFSGRGGGLKQK
jgi:hypothetical protein